MLEWPFRRCVVAMMHRPKRSRKQAMTMSVGPQGHVDPESRVASDAPLADQSPPPSPHSAPPSSNGNGNGNGNGHPKPWSLQDSARLYGIQQWGNGYFSINGDGHVAV